MTFTVCAISGVWARTHKRTSKLKVFILAFSELAKVFTLPIFNNNRTNFVLWRDDSSYFVKKRLVSHFNG